MTIEIFIRNVSMLGVGRNGYDRFITTLGYLYKYIYIQPVLGGVK